MNRGQSYNDMIEKLKGTDKEFEEKIIVSQTVAKVMANLIEARVEKGMTQRDLAEVSGLKQSAIARMEKLNVIPKIDTIARLAYHLGLEMNVQKHECKTIIVKLDNVYNSYNELYYETDSLSKNYSVSEEENIYNATKSKYIAYR